MLRRRTVWVPLLLVGTLALAGGLFWFQPWKLFVDHRVDEKLPDVAQAQAQQPAQKPAADVTGTIPAATPTALPATTAGTKTDAAPRTTATPKPVARLLARGTLITHEHETSGTVSVVQQPDGSRVLAIADLRTSDGPDVKIWLTDQRVRPGEGGWNVFDDGRYSDLGSLKGNLGNQLYQIPAGVDLKSLTSVSLWCDRFDVSFGAAELKPLN